MTADAMQRQPVGQFRRAVVEGDAAGKDMADEGDDILDMIGVPEESVAHAAPGGVGGLGILHMEAGARKVAQRPRMVVVELGQHDLVDPRRVDAEQRQRRSWPAQERAAAGRCLITVEAGVDDEEPVRAARDPDEIVEV